MQREHKFIPLKNVEIKAADDSGLFVFEGYAAKFGAVDTYRDTIEKGAFAATIEQWKAGGKIHMYYNHNYDDWLNARPLRIGKWIELYEDEVGLYCKGELTPSHSLANDVGASIKHKTIDGLSIGYVIPPGGSVYDSEQNIRTLKQIDLYEISPVDEPADRGARIGDVKSLISEVKSLPDAEKLLRDAGNFSRSEATAIVAQIKQALQRDAGVRAVDPVDAALKSLQNVNFNFLNH